MPNKEGPKSQHRRHRRRASRLALAAFFALTAVPTAFTAPCRASDHPVIHGFGAKDRALVINGQGKGLLSLNADEPSVPASTIKILTALSALSHLGPDYRFETTIHIDAKKNLYVKGWGDPFLISEAIEEMASSIASETKTLEAIILDDSFFERAIEIPGRENSTNPYDAPVGALCANFNTVFFHTGKDGRPVSAEPQTPMTEFASTKIRSSGLSKGRINFLNDSGEAALYFGHLLAHFLRERGVAVRGQVRTGVAPGSSPNLVYASRFTLARVIESMMEYSNNFIANQIAVALGAHLFGAPGNMEKARRALESFGRTRLGLKSLTVAEGSGISRENRISPRDMVELLAAFEPYRALLRRNNSILYKSGTLRGIKARAGYVEKGGNRPWRFAFFLEGSRSDADSMMKEIEKAAR